MKKGDKVTVPVKTQKGRRTVTTQAKGTIVAVCNAQELYDEPPLYPSRYKHDKKETKFPVGDKIIQVLIDGRTIAVNCHESEVRLVKS
jgi:hypothetical protein